MGFGIKELVVILVIVILLFGTKKLKSLGGDLGGAIRGFKKSMADDDQAPEEKPGATDEDKASTLKQESAEPATDTKRDSTKVG